MNRCSASLFSVGLAPLLVALVALGTGGAAAAPAALAGTAVAAAASTPLRPGALAAALPFSTAAVTTPQVRAELVAHAPEGIAAGRPFWLGLLIEHQPHWHTYWKNPGDSGLATALTWTLPAGLEAGEIRWPAPRRLPVGPLVNYGYEGTVLLPVQVEVPPDFAATRVDVRLHADWLVCKEVCIPEAGDFSLAVPATAATAGHAEAFEQAWRAHPEPLAGARATAAAEGDVLAVQVSGLPPAWQGAALEFFPETVGVLANAAPPRDGQWEGPQWRARLALDPQRSEAPARVAAVLRPQAGAGVADAAATPVALEIEVTTPWPAAAARPPAPALGNAEVVSERQARPGATGPLGAWFATLGLAFVGGLVLNLMPCVFPILSLKVLGFASDAQDRRRLATGGLAYTAGVVVSFVALAALLLALRAGGRQLGWGFQLQSPLAVAALALLFTLIGLNLAGVWQFGMLLPSRLASARARHPVVDAAWTGVLAVAVASPCTGPFMGASLGVALTLPAAEALSVFAALGLGMAAPYLAASLWPRLAQALPRPGVWMVHLRTLLAFPMFATVVWLVWVLGRQVGIDGAVALLGTLVAVGFAAWAFGPDRFGRPLRLAVGALALVVLAGTLAWALPAWREPPPGAAAAAPSDDGWEPWSAERVAELSSQGRPVFVDFTAAWCVTCQYNKRTTFADASLRADFATRRVALLRADWTRRDAAIAAELARLGRSGVPAYVLHAPYGASTRLLSEMPSVAEVREALAALPPSSADALAAPRP